MDVGILTSSQKASVLLLLFFCSCVALYHPSLILCGLCCSLDFASPSWLQPISVHFCLKHAHPQPPPLVIWRSLQHYITFGIFAILCKTLSHFAKMCLFSFWFCCLQLGSCVTVVCFLNNISSAQERFYRRIGFDRLRYGLTNYFCYSGKSWIICSNAAVIYTDRSMLNKLWLAQNQNFPQTRLTYFNPDHLVQICMSNQNEVMAIICSSWPWMLLSLWGGLYGVMGCHGGCSLKRTYHTHFWVFDFDFGLKKQEHYQLLSCAFLHSPKKKKRHFVGATSNKVVSEQSGGGAGTALCAHSWHAFIRKSSVSK